MTCIVGLVHNGRVHLGGDSAGVAYDRVSTRRDPKVFANGPYVMGFTSSFRMGQVLQHAFTPPKPDGELHRFMVTSFVDSLREALQIAGVAEQKNGVESGGVFLVGVAGRLFRIDDDYQVGENVASYAAVGCGDQVAHGALYATRPTMAPRRRLTIALEAAAEHSGWVRGPWTFASTKAER